MGFLLSVLSGVAAWFASSQIGPSGRIERIVVARREIE